MEVDIREHVVESIVIGDVHLQIVQRDAGDRSRFAARFGPTADSVAHAPAFEMIELHELESSVSAAIAIMRYVERETGVVELGQAIATVREEHKISEGPR